MFTLRFRLPSTMISNDVAVEEELRILRVASKQIPVNRFKAAKGFPGGDSLLLGFSGTVRAQRLQGTESCFFKWNF